MNHYEQYIGQILDGRYRINALLGVGGMAAVLVAKDLKTNRNVAIKMLKEDYANDKQAVLRFINEGKAVAMLDHENIVKIYDVVVTDKEKYLVMKYIEGEILRSYMDRMGPLPFEKAVDILAQILTALDHAHRKGIVHRDIKPQNVMILKSGKVILTDFGIAQIAGGNTVIDDKAIGTVYYISPEQASGEPIDARSDLYSLGAMAFEMLTGKLPFYADSAVSVALMQINSQAPSPREYLPTIPVGMEQIILFAMAKSPKERFQSAGQMLLYLNTLKADPFAEFAVSPKEQYRNALEEERKAGEARKKAEAEAKETEKPKQNVKTVRGDSWSPMPVILGVLTSFFIVLMVAGYYFVENIFLKSELNVFADNSGENVKVENFVGKPFGKTEKEYVLNDLRYKEVIIKDEDQKSYNATVPKGSVTRQEPAAGKTYKLSNLTLTVYISKGAGEEQENLFPDYTMQDYRIVRSELSSKFKVQTVPVTTATATENKIVRQEPEAGSRITEGMTVILYYSIGPEAEKVIYNFPDFSGMTELEVKYYVETHELNLVEIRYEYSEDVASGRVISSSVSAGPQPKLTPISIVFSLGVDPEKILPVEN